MNRACVVLLLMSACGGKSAKHDGGTIPDSATNNDSAIATPDDSGQTSPPDSSMMTTADSGGVTPPIALFEMPEPWTKDVSALSPDSHSAAIISALSSAGGWGQGNQLQVDFSIPLFFADSSTPTQVITAPAGGYCYGGPDCDSVPLTIPLPANGNIEGSKSYVCDTTYKTNGQGDCHLLVAEPSTHKLYELYNSTQKGSALTALGAFVWKLDEAYPDNLRGDQCTSADAGGFPIAGLLVTADEVATGTVGHALRFILPNERMRAGFYVHPGTHVGAPSSGDANAPPYGVRFRLKPTFSTTGYSAGAKVIIKALQQYGMLLSDGGNVALTFADDRTTTAKWATLGVTAQTFEKIGVSNFDVVDFSTPVAYNGNCVRNP